MLRLAALAYQLVRRNSCSIAPLGKENGELHTHVVSPIIYHGFHEQSDILHMKQPKLSLHELAKLVIEEFFSQRDGWMVETLPRPYPQGAHWPTVLPRGSGSQSLNITLINHSLKRQLGNVCIPHEVLIIKEHQQLLTVQFKLLALLNASMTKFRAPQAPKKVARDSSLHFHCDV